MAVLPSAIDGQGIHPGGDPRILPTDQSVTPYTSAPLSRHLAHVPDQGA